MWRPKRTFLWTWNSPLFLLVNSIIEAYSSEQLTWFPFAVFLNNQMFIYYTKGFTNGANGKVPAKAGDMCLIPGLQRFPGVGTGNPLP